MTNRIHHLFAVVTHPILVTFYGLAYATSTHVVSYGRLNESQSGWFLVILFLSTTIIPLLTLGLLFKKFTASEWAVISMSDRRAAATLMGAVYILLYFAYREFFPDPLIGIFMVAAGASSIVAGILQIWMKTSFHMSALGGLLVLVLYMAKAGVCLVEPKWPVTFVVLLTGAVAWSRLTIKAHRPAEIYLGYCIGLLASAAVFLFAYGF